MFSIINSFQSVKNVITTIITLNHFIYRCGGNTNSKLQFYNVEYINGF